MEFIPEPQGWSSICKSISVIYYIDKRKDKNHMILSIEAEKTFNNIEYPSLIKTLQSVGIEGTYLNIIKAIPEKPTANSILNRGKMKSFSPKVRDTTGMSTLTVVVQHSTRSPSLSSQTTKRNKRHPSKSTKKSNSQSSQMT